MQSTEILIPGQIVQYRKVGTFRVVGHSDGWDAAKCAEFRGAGWYDAEAVKAPKSYRDAGVRSFWIGPENVVG